MDGTSRLSLNEKPVYHYCGLSCLSEYAVVPASSCVVIPNDISSEIGALVGCAVTTGVGAALNTVQVSRGDSVVVFGAGGVGLSTIMGAAYTGADKIIAKFRQAEKMLEDARATALTFFEKKKPKDQELNYDFNRYKNILLT